MTPEKIKRIQLSIARAESENNDLKEKVAGYQWQIDKLNVLIASKTEFIDEQIKKTGR